jgi:hypothetical protein
MEPAEVVRFEPPNQPRVRALCARRSTFRTTCKTSRTPPAWSSQFAGLHDRFANYGMAGPHNVFSPKKIITIVTYF